MELNVMNSNQLLVLANDSTLIEDLTYQIEKDFGLANISLKLPLKFDAQTFIAAIREKVYYLMMEHFSEYLNLLYVVDIPESQFQQIEITDAVEVADQMTFLILKREYQKVWYRNRYK
ncbi:hypothetical protein [uncultured Maribacter sp.]|uniref:hypothetical protein n=1 Tax=uncultured Maribacter sp. TaxID=431308 RepID=UPI0030ED964E|tara:strand:+ start:6450 stop:6803 length:354 start_codon:yes stop_codon:yes gene_type:complete